MQKIKNIKASKRRTKSGKIVDVKEHSASYTSANDMAKEAIKSRTGAGAEFKSKTQTVDPKLQQALDKYHIYVMENGKPKAFLKGSKEHEAFKKSGVKATPVKDAKTLSGLLAKHSQSAKSTTGSTGPKVNKNPKPGGTTGSQPKSENKKSAFQEGTVSQDGRYLFKNGQWQKRNTGKTASTEQPKQTVVTPEEKKPASKEKSLVTKSQRASANKIVSDLANKRKLRTRDLLKKYSKWATIAAALLAL